MIQTIPGSERPTPEFWDRFAKLRADVFAAIKKELEMDGYHKSYEGSMSVRFPHYFHDADDDAWGVTLDCYVLGPSRHYEWAGRTAPEALDAAENEIRSWLAETETEYASGSWR